MNKEPCAFPRYLGNFVEPQNFLQTRKIFLEEPFKVLYIAYRTKKGSTVHLFSKSGIAYSVPPTTHIVYFTILRESVDIFLCLLNIIENMQWYSWKPIPILCVHYNPINIHHHKMNTNYVMVLPLFWYSKHRVIYFLKTSS